MKPDVTAPGVDVLVLGAAPRGHVGVFSGTSMAAPHVAGAAALLRQRHPGWTVEQIKSALVQTGEPVLRGVGGRGRRRRARAAARIDLPRADNPLLFASPTGLSFGLVAPGGAAARQVALTDAGGGAGPWNVSVTLQQAASGVSVSVLADRDACPATLVVTATAAPGAAAGDAHRLRRAQPARDTRRIPFWFRVARAALATEPRTPLTRTGTYHGDTRGRPSRVDSLPLPGGRRAGSAWRALVARARAGLPRRAAQPGRELRRRRHRRGVTVEPRVVRHADENQLTGDFGLPYNANPYLRRFGTASRSLAPRFREQARTTSSSTAQLQPAAERSRSGSGSVTRRLRV